MYKAQQDYGEIVHNLDRTLNKLTGADLSAVQHENLQENVQELQKYNKDCFHNIMNNSYKMYLKLKKMDITSESADLSPVQHENLREPLRDLQKLNKECFHKFYTSLQTFWNSLYRLNEIDPLLKANARLLREQQERSGSQQEDNSSKKPLWQVLASLHRHSQLSDNLQELLEAQQEKHEECKLLQKLYNVHQKLYERVSELIPTVLSLAQREDTKQDACRELLQDVVKAIASMSSTLIKGQEDIVRFRSREEREPILKIYSSGAEEFGKIVEEQKQVLDYMQKQTAISESEQDTLIAIARVSQHLLSNISKQFRASSAILDRSFSIDDYNSWKEDFDDQKKYLNVLKKYFKTPVEFQKIHNDVLGMHKENLEILGKSLAKDLSSHLEKRRNQRKKENDSRVRLIDALEKFSSRSTNPHLPSAEHEEREVLDKWHKALGSLSELDPKSKEYKTKRKSIEELNRTYNGSSST